MDWTLYIQLSAMMFLQYAIWGAWAPVLGAHLLGPLKMSGKQTGWIYAALPMACMISPFIGGQMADRWISTQWVLAASHLAGGVVLLFAARQRKFPGLFALMCVYSFLYSSTVSLTNSLMFVQMKGHQLSDMQAGLMRVWGTIGWIVAGLGLVLWRRTRKEPGRSSDCLNLTAVISLVMGTLCLFLPNTPPTPGGETAFLKALKMLGEPQFLIFVIISFVVTTELQFYYVPTAAFLEDLGVKTKNVSGVMTIAQFAEIIGMVVLWPWAFSALPKESLWRWVLAIGVIAWPMRYIVFAIMRPLGLVMGSLAFHGIGYTFFFFAGQKYVDTVAPDDIKASAQALIFGVTLGLGNFIGTQFTGVILDHFKTPEGKFRWRPIFLIPCALTIACAIAFLLFFRG